MKNLLWAILISFTVIATGHTASSVFSHEVLQIIQKHWTVEDKMFIKLDPWVCDNMTDNVCYLLDKLFEESSNLGWQISFVGPCKPYPIVGNVAYHRSD